VGRSVLVNAAVLIRFSPASTFDFGAVNALHSHSSELKNVIISGVWYTGTDAASAKDFGPGSIVIMPGNWVHVSGCRSGADCVFYQEGKGKFDFKPAADATKPDK